MGPCKNKNWNVPCSRYPKSDMTIRFNAIDLPGNDLLKF